MSDAETIKQFMVALGFKIDESSFKKFDGAIGQTTKSVAALGLGVVAAAAATEAFVAKIASGLDKLYFASKRTGASASEISSFEYAVGQLGGTADEALDSLEGLKQYMRENYAGGLLTQLGVDPANLKDTKKVLDNLAPIFRRMVANNQEPLMWAYAKNFHINRNTAQAMLDPQFEEKEHAQEAMQKQQGINLEELTAKGMEFTKQLNTLDTSFGLLVLRIEGHLLPLMGRLNQMIIDMAAGRTSQGIKGLIDYIGENSWLPGAIDGAGQIGESISKSVGEWLSGEHTAVPATVNAIGAASGYVAGKMGQGFGQLLPSGNIKNNNPGNLEIPGGVAFQKFPDAMAGLVAMAKQLELYAKRGNDTVMGIVNTYAPAGDHNNVPAYIQDIMKRTGFSATEHLNLKDPQVLSKLMSAMVWHEQGRNPFSATLIPSAANQVALGGNKGGATLHMTNNVTVNGADNPADTASSVAFAVKDSGQQMRRNLNSVVQ